MAKKQKVNYSSEDVQILTDGYNPDADQETRDAQVKTLAADLGRKPASIIAKLVNLKVYVKKVTIAKDGKPSMSKDKRVTAIAEKLGMLPELLDSLANANVSVIKMIDELIDSRNMAVNNLAAVVQSATDAGFDLNSESEETSESSE